MTPAQSKAAARENLAAELQGIANALRASFPRVEQARPLNLSAWPPETWADIEAASKGETE